MEEESKREKTNREIKSTKQGRELLFRQKRAKKSSENMALFLDEEEVWKCPKHPSKRRRSGICPICLRDRLATLCPDCANVRPCFCYATSSSSCSSSSSSFSRFSVTGDASGISAVGRVCNLMEREPALQRSRSMAIPFLRSRSRFSGGSDRDLDPSSAKDSLAMNGSKSARSFWSVFKLHKSNRGGAPEQDSKTKIFTEVHDGDLSRKVMMVRSRSVAVAAVSGTGNGELRQRTKGKGWFFPSPMKAFRHSKAYKVVQERSPLYRG